jgi:Domain of unknown function (DUF4124)
MKRVIILAVALSLAPAAFAQLYKYVDKDGKTVYSDQPPANVESKQINIPSGRTSDAPAPSSPTSKTAVERDKDQQKGRDEAKEKQKKVADVEKKAEADEQRCSQAKSAYATYADGGRIRKYNDKGEAEYLGDAELESERVRTRREMEEACKKS